MTRKAAVARAFGAARDYERHAGVQRRVAASLVERIAELPLPERPRVLDVGAGTGFLPALLAPRLPGARWVISDLSVEMVQRARAALPAGSGGFVAMDAAHPCFPDGSFDLVCSNLAAQWFDDLAGSIAALGALVAPGGLLALSTLASRSFAEWRAAHEALGLVPATPDFPDAASLAALAPPGTTATIAVEHIVQRHDDARDLLRGLRGLGATVPRPERKPLGPRAMRAVMAQFESIGATISYEIAYCLFRRGAG
jgi:malonyl-CoA O-methyltransferase